MKGVTTVVLDVEGILFKTTLTTLQSIRNSTLSHIVAGGEWKKQLDQQGHIFIDRDSRIFPVILAYLRDGNSIPLPNDEWTLAKIAHEARYFNLPDLERLAMKKRSTVMDSMTNNRGLIPLKEVNKESYEMEKVEIPMKKSQVDKKVKRRSSILNHLSISLPRNFAHIAHIGWKGSDLILSTNSQSKSEEPQMKALAKAAKESPASQVYNVVDGDSTRYGSQGVEVVISSDGIRSLPPHNKAPIPPFRPPPPM